MIVHDMNNRKDADNLKTFLTYYGSKARLMRVTSGWLVLEII